MKTSYFSEIFMDYFINILKLLWLSCLSYNNLLFSIKIFNSIILLFYFYYYWNKVVYLRKKYNFYFNCWLLLLKMKRLNLYVIFYLESKLLLKF